MRLSYLVPFLALQADASGQANRFSVTESYAPSSPLTVAFSPADIVVVNSTMTGGGGRQWEAGDLGLTASANVDAFSDGNDFFPVVGPAVVPPPAVCEYLQVEFTVDLMSAGLAGGLVESESTSDGAASDTFIVDWIGAPTGSISLGSDALAVSPLPLETDLDALAWRQRRRFPVFFSVDRTTAATLSGIDAGDILVTTTLGGPPVVLFDAVNDLGLTPDDNIDALAVRSNFSLPASPTGTVVFSLDRSSPTVLPGSPPNPLDAVGPGGLLTIAAGAPTPWALPAQLDLEVSADNLNGVRITDPSDRDWIDGGQTSPTTGFPHDAVLFDGSRGNSAGQVFLDVGAPFTFSIELLEPAAQAYLLFARFGKPCFGEQFFVPEAGATMAVSPLLSFVNVFGSGDLTAPGLSLPGPADLAVQALVLDGLTLDVTTTNMAVAVVQ